jgi:hypothetical protein
MKVSDRLIRLEAEMESLNKSMDRLVISCAKIFDLFHQSTMMNKDLILLVRDEIAANSKRLSSIEMEMIISRGGCLDNNFEGKEDL